MGTLEYVLWCHSNGQSLSVNTPNFKKANIEEQVWESQEAFDLLDIIRNGAMKMKKLKVMIRTLGFVA